MLNLSYHGIFFLFYAASFDLLLKIIYMYCILVQVVFYAICYNLQTILQMKICNMICPGIPITTKFEKKNRIGMEMLTGDFPDFGMYVSTYCTIRDLIVAHKVFSVVNLLRSLLEVIRLLIILTWIVVRDGTIRTIGLGIG